MSGTLVVSICRRDGNSIRPDYHEIIRKDMLLRSETARDGLDEKPGYFTYAPVKHNRYYLENLPQFLDAPGEYYFAAKGPNAESTSCLPGDEDPTRSRSRPPKS